MPASADIIQNTLKDSHYALSLFTKHEISALRNRAFSKETRGKQVVFVTCVVRN